MRRRRSFPRSATAGSRGFGTSYRRGVTTGAGSSRGMISGSGGCRATIALTGCSLGMIAGTGSPGRAILRTRGSRAAIALTGCSLAMIAGTRGSGRTISRTGCSLAMIPGTGAPWGTIPLESLIPSSSLAAVVLVIKILVIGVTNLVSAPHRILSLKIIPVLRMSLIPRIPPRRIPVFGSDNIDGRIGVIRGKSISGAEKVLKDSIQKPITFVKGPGCIIPHPRGRGNRLARGWIIALSGSRSGHRADRASSQQNYQHQKSN